MQLPDRKFILHQKEFLLYVPKLKALPNPWSNQGFSKTISSFIDETDELKINEYRERIMLNKKALKKINKLRKLVGNSMI